MGSFHSDQWFSDLTFIVIVGTLLGSFIAAFVMMAVTGVASALCRWTTGKGIHGSYHYAKDEAAQIIMGLAILGVFIAEAIWVISGIYGTAQG